MTHKFEQVQIPITSEHSTCEKIVVNCSNQCEMITYFQTVKHKPNRESNQQTDSALNDSNRSNHCDIFDSNLQRIRSTLNEFQLKVFDHMTRYFLDPASLEELPFVILLGYPGSGEKITSYFQ